MEELWTIGHGKRPMARFLKLLATEKINVVSDIRLSVMRTPGYHPTELAHRLLMAGIAYHPAEGLRAGADPESRGEALRMVGIQLRNGKRVCLVGRDPNPLRDGRFDVGAMLVERGICSRVTPIGIGKLIEQRRLF